MLLDMNTELANSLKNFLVYASRVFESINYHVDYILREKEIYLDVTIQGACRTQF
jgi:hypothetical protein